MEVFGEVRSQEIDFRKHVQCEMAKDIHAEVLSRQSEAKPERDVREPKVYRQTAFEARRLQELTEEGG